MAFIPVPGTVEVAIEAKLNGQDCKNILNFHTGATIDAEVLSVLGAALIDAIVGSTWFAGAASIAYTLLDLKLTDFKSATAASIIQTTGATHSLPATGTISGVSAQNNSALVVSSRTGNRGRSYRGRTYFPTMDTGSTLSGVQATTDYINAVLTLMTAINSAADANAFEPVVVSRKSGGVDRVTGISTPVVAYSCNPALDSQRRRLQGRGS